MEKKAFNLSEIKRSIEVTCRICTQKHFLKVVQADYDRWKNGELIQRALPYLTADERELLISKTCGDCYDKMFK